MKICFATDYLPGYHRYWGGAEQACYRLAKLLHKKGEEISIIVTKPIKAISENFECCSVPVLEDYFPSKIKNLVRGLKTSLVPYDIMAYFHVKHYLEKLKPEILHLHNFSSISFSIMSQGKNFGIKTFLTAYDYWFICPLGFLWIITDYSTYKGEPCTRYHGTHCIECLSKLRNFNKLEKFILSTLLPYRKKIFDHFLKKIDGFIVLSESNAEVLERYGITRKQIHVVHIPLSEKLDLSLSSNLERNSILYIGWLHPRKGLHILIQAMPYVLKKIPEAKLYILGGVGKYDKEFEQSILKFISRHNLKDNVFLLGKRPFHEVRSYLQRVNILVIPEQWETIAPNSLTEGMVFGKAVVAGSIGGVLDIIKDGENGLLATYNEPRDYANKIIMLLQDEALSKRLAKKAMETGLSLFSEEKVYNELLKAYHS